MPCSNADHDLAVRLVRLHQPVRGLDFFGPIADRLWQFITDQAAEIIPT
jgi:hypothetical protein